MKRLIVVLSILVSVNLSGQIVPGVVASSGGTTNTLLNGLLAFYPLNETSGTTAIDDFSTYDLTNSGATINQTVGGEVGYQFAPNDYVGNYNGFKFTTAFSLSLRINTTYTGAYHAPIGNYHWTGDGYDLIVEQSTGHLLWAVRNSTNGEAELDGNVNIANGSWHNVVCIYDGSYIRLYVDGVAATPMAFSYTITYNSANRFCIGTRENDDNFFTGYIRNVSIYNRALTATEVSTLNTNNGRPY
jgi:hypothetical protein